MMIIDFQVKIFSFEKSLERKSGFQAFQKKTKVRKKITKQNSDENQQLYGVLTGLDRRMFIVYVLE